MPEDLPPESSIKPMLEEGRRSKKKLQAKVEEDKKGGLIQDKLL
jgi:hypothetical protein